MKSISELTSFPKIFIHRHEVYDLTPKRAYSFRVRAENAKGFSRYSPTAVYITRDSACPAPKPPSLAVGNGNKARRGGKGKQRKKGRTKAPAEPNQTSSVGPNFICLQWEAPSCAGSPIGEFLQSIVAFPIPFPVLLKYATRRTLQS